MISVNLKASKVPPATLLVMKQPKQLNGNLYYHPEKEMMEKYFSKLPKYQCTLSKMNPHSIGTKTNPKHVMHKKKIKKVMVRKFFTFKNLMIVSLLFLNVFQVRATNKIQNKDDYINLGNKYRYNTNAKICGDVYQGIDVSTNELVAIKRIKLTLDNTAYTEELAILKKLNTDEGHPNIIRLIDVVYQNKFAYIVTEYLSEGTLANFINKGNLNKTIAKRIFKEIVQAVIYMHGKDVVHRDLKPDNILLKKDIHGKLIPVVIDFGISFDFKTPPGKSFSSLGAHIGTRIYYAPAFNDVFIDKNDINSINFQLKKYAESADVWSLGVILFVMLTGKNVPVEAVSNYNGVVLPNSLYSLFTFKILPQYAKNLIKEILKSEPNDRIELQNILEHNWYTYQGNWLYCYFCSCERKQQQPIILSNNN